MAFTTPDMLNKESIIRNWTCSGDSCRCRCRCRVVTMSWIPVVDKEEITALFSFFADSSSGKNEPSVKLLGHGKKGLVFGTSITASSCFSCGCWMEGSEAADVLLTDAASDWDFVGILRVFVLGDE